MLATVYARHERTTESHYLKYVPEKQLNEKNFQDVVFYRDKECTQFYCRIPAGYTQSKPTRRNKYIVLNCVRYNLVWVEPPERKRVG